MEVKIGVVYTPHELIVETDDDASTITSVIEEAMTAESILWLTDTKGRRIGVPVDKIAYVEVGSDASGRQVGFGTR
ncbi:MAG: hypothetical protein JWL83_3272 [Actinomycetia bacterium]|nr:hypothetical protein [Actinomycetes bacterium]